MKLIAGLGNIGDKYVFTRHNAGFMVVDKLAIKYGISFKEEKRFKCFLSKFRIGSEDFLVMKPTTYMNLSGEALISVVNYYKIDIKDLIVVYDDLSIPLGKIRFRSNGSDGGHNGIKSIIKHLGTSDFARLKVGIGPQLPVPAENFVLQNFSKEQLDELIPVLNHSVDALEYYFGNGMGKTQNTFN